jgi:AcrR family transcriptional regulator
MPRTGGDKTKLRILQTAERLFSEKGFDGSGIDEIARLSGINKATIYYHFRDKAALVSMLFQKILDEVDLYVSNSPPEQELKAIASEIEYLEGKKKILTILLTESLKESSSGEALFRCADKVIRGEHPEVFREGEGDGDLRAGQRTLTKEFFTGFVPILAFILLRDKFRRHFGIADNDLLEDFLNAFRETHSCGKE